MSFSDQDKQTKAKDEQTTDQHTTDYGTVSLGTNVRDSILKTLEILEIQRMHPNNNTNIEPPILLPQNHKYTSPFIEWRKTSQLPLIFHYNEPYNPCNA